MIPPPVVPDFRRLDGPAALRRPRGQSSRAAPGRGSAPPGDHIDAGGRRRAPGSSSVRSRGSRHPVEADRDRRSPATPGSRGALSRSIADDAAGGDTRWPGVRPLGETNPSAGRPGDAGPDDRATASAGGPTTPRRRRLGSTPRCRHRRGWPPAGPDGLREKNPSGPSPRRCNGVARRRRRPLDLAPKRSGLRQCVVRRRRGRLRRPLRTAAAGRSGPVSATAEGFGSGTATMRAARRAAGPIDHRSCGGTRLIAGGRPLAPARLAYWSSPVPVDSYGLAHCSRSLAARSSLMGDR